MATRKAKAAKRKPAILRGIKATVSIDRGPGRIVVEGVPVEHAGNILAALMDELRELSKTHQELVPDLGQVGGYHPVEFVDDYEEECGGVPGKRRIGFRVTKGPPTRD